MKNKFLKSVLALLAGFFAVLILSIATDIFLAALGIMPMSPEAYQSGSLHINLLLLLALTYRGIYGALGSYIAAALAPERPMYHAMLLGWIGFVLATLGAIANFDKSGPSIWYPILLVIITPVCAWLGGKFYLNRSQNK